MQITQRHTDAIDEAMRAALGKDASQVQADSTGSER
jgi:hypothetical protein